MRDNSIRIALLCLSAAAAALADPLLVELCHGTLRGRDNGGYYSYESIPYAEPPVGALRFEAPQPYSQQWSGIFDATKPPVNCMQWDQYTNEEDKLTGCEDCLTVNVYRPKNCSRSTFPVIVNVHGGAFMFGGVSGNGHETFMASGNVIVVKFSYRLGPLGFASTGDAVMPGNFGLKDQRLALEWIKENIARFGGEPENILVVGFSSGAVAVQLHLLREDFQHIAKAAASMSGSALAPCAVQEGGRQRAFELGRILGCGLLSDSTELKECLKTKDAQDIVRAVRQFLVFDYVSFTPFGPVVEPEDAPSPFITQHPIDIIRSGRFAHIPWLASFTKEDGAYNAAILLKKQWNGQELIEELNSRWFELAPHFFFYRDTMRTVQEMDDYSRALRQQYLGDRSFSVENYFDVQRMVTDAIYRNASLRSVDLLARHGKSPVYLYIYDNPAEQGRANQLANRTDISIGSGHGDDYFLIFESASRQPVRPDEEIISQHLIKMLEDFVQGDGGCLAYDSCVFPTNVCQEQLGYVLIKSNTCEISYTEPIE